MLGYEMDELMPVVAELTRKHTSGESSSVTYETARHLMEAVLYCIGELEGDTLPVGGKTLSAGQAYRLGCGRVREKVEAAEQAYKELLSHFSAYGNENYYDTVVKGIAGFFTCYDVRFSPQETIITMDYRLSGAGFIEWENGYRCGVGIYQVYCAGTEVSGSVSGGLCS